MKMDPRISIITLGVEDLQRSIEFYRDGLGLPMKENGDEIAFFTTSSTWLSLYPLEKLRLDVGVSSEGSGFGAFTLAHNLNSKEEVDSLMEHAIQSGARLIKQPQDADWGGYSGYFSDPDDFLWELAWNPYFEIK
jgi:catechol 2,3-dioxygenase-like lactoylglutathione lyase family enzyme